MMILCLPVITSPKCQRVAENITLYFIVIKTLQGSAVAQTGSDGLTTHLQVAHFLCAKNYMKLGWQ